MPTVTYPDGGITPHGQYLDAKGRYPTVHLAAHDGTVEFYLLGGRSIPWPDAPESVRFTRNGIKGLIAPWKRIAQKGATEDGESFIDALYDPAEPEFGLRARARSPQYLQKVTHQLVNSLDAIRTSPVTITKPVSLINPTVEKWWADVRWNKTPTEPFIWGDRRYQDMTLRLLIDDAFWRSEADICERFGTYLPCLNIGDQTMYRDHICIGPGTFSIGVTPGVGADTIQFGPLLENQVVMLRTDPRKTTIVDLTATPPTPQELTDWQQAVEDFTDWASGGNSYPLLQEIESWFGIQPPQGNLYSLLSGRFSTKSAIPPAPASGTATAYQVFAAWTGGNENSNIISVGVPRRRYPL